MSGAQQAKDRLLEHATEIRMRAEIRAGELLAESNAKGERAKAAKKGEKGKRELQPAALDDIGITKTQSSRRQKLVALSKDNQ